MTHIERSHILGIGYSQTRAMDAVLEMDEAEVVLGDDGEPISEYAFALGEAERPTMEVYRTIRGLLMKELDHSISDETERGTYLVEVV